MYSVIPYSHPDSVESSFTKRFTCGYLENDKSGKMKIKESKSFSQRLGELQQRWYTEVRESFRYTC